MCTQPCTLDDQPDAASVTIDLLMDRATAHPGVAPLLHSMFIENERLLTPMRQALRVEDLDAYLATVAQIWTLLASMDRADQVARLEQAMTGLQFHSVDFLRRQARFVKTGEYQAEGAAAVYEQVYQSHDVMQQYLDGLLLTYVAWPNHYRLIQFYGQRYLTECPYGRCLEIGPGHGWLALAQLQADAANTLLGVDISPHSVAYSKNLLSAAGVDSERFEIREGDATAQGGFPVGPFDRIVIAEVLEHVERPDELLRRAIDNSHSQTLLFISTVVNIEAIDHLYLFRTLDEIREMLDACGLKIVDELDMALAFEAADNSYEVALICRPK